MDGGGRLAAMVTSSAMYRALWGIGTVVQSL